MNTHNKIQLGERDPGSLKRTVSGGVSEPSDPSHYPDLSGSPSPRASSRLSQSFKSTVMADNDEDAVLHGAASRSTQSSASPERTASPSGSQGSPKIPAQRHTSSLSPSSACLIDTTAAASNRQQVGQIYVYRFICIARILVEYSALFLLANRHPKLCAQSLTDFLPAVMLSIWPDCRPAEMLRMIGGSLCPLGGRSLQREELLITRQRKRSRRAPYTIFLPIQTPLMPCKKRRKETRWTTLLRF